MTAPTNPAMAADAPPTPCTLANAQVQGGQVVLSFGSTTADAQGRETVALHHQVALDAAAARHLRRMLALLVADQAQAAGQPKP